MTGGLVGFERKKKRKNMNFFLVCSEMFVYLQRGFVSVELE